MATLSPMEKKILLRWKKQALPGLYTLVEIEDGDAIVMGAEAPDSVNARFWRVHALVSDWEELTHYKPLPVTFLSVLLPFGNRIIYDGSVFVVNREYTEELIQSIYESWRLAKEQGTIVTGFPPGVSMRQKNRKDGKKRRR